MIISASSRRSSNFFSSCFSGTISGACTSSCNAAFIMSGGMDSCCGKLSVDCNDAFCEGKTAMTPRVVVSSVGSPRGNVRPSSGSTSPVAAMALLSRHGGRLVPASSLSCSSSIILLFSVESNDAFCICFWRIYGCFRGCAPPFSRPSSITVDKEIDAFKSSDDNGGIPLGFRQSVLSSSWLLLPFVSLFRHGGVFFCERWRARE